MMFMMNWLLISHVRHPVSFNFISNASLPNLEQYYTRIRENEILQGLVEDLIQKGLNRESIIFSNNITSLGPLFFFFFGMTYYSTADLPKEPKSSSNPTEAATTITRFFLCNFSIVIKELQMDQELQRLSLMHKKYMYYSNKLFNILMVT